MSKGTGPGRIALNPNAPTGGVRASLVNFDVDGDALKKEHGEFLDRTVVPIMIQQNARLFLQGRASHPGSDAHNMDLSRRRAQGVVAHLKSRGVLEGRMKSEFVGESLAGSFQSEDSEARSVSLLAVRLFEVPALGPRLPVPKPAPATPTASAFKIRLLGALSAGIGPVQVERLFFQIWDPAHALTSFYMYQSGGVGKGVGASVSTTLRGPFNDFRTTRPLAVNTFAGAARFTTIGVGPFSSNILNIMGLPPATATIPNPLPIETGFTVGLGASTSVGELVLGFTGPFSGP